MERTKLVDGKVVALTADENGARDAEDAAFAERKAREAEQGVPVVVAYGAFLARWTDAEKEVFFLAERNSWQLRNWAGMAMAEGAITVNGRAALAAKAALVAAGILTAERAAEIFAP